MPPASERIQTAYEARLRELEDTAEKRERQLTILSRVAARVHGEDDVSRILEIALDEILSEMHLQTAWVFMGDERDGKLHLAAHRGVAQSYLDAIRRDGLGECLCPEVFWTGHTMQARNTVECPRMPGIVEGLHERVAHACIPLKFDGGSRGVLNVAARPGEQFDADELRFLETLGHQICLAVERARHLETERAAQAHIIQTEKMAMMGTFASGLAHEVRNPLNSMGLQLSLLERRTAAAGADTREIVGIIRAEIKRLEALVNDFLLLARTSRMSFHRADLSALADEVVRLLAPEAEAAGVRLELQHRGAALPEVLMDAEKMKQVVINLVRNAIEAMPGGGSVVVATQLRGERACLRVTDTGPGLPEEIDVFQLFVSTKPGGTGLGLSIAQQIVLDHGGDIQAESRKQEGTVFTVCLPLSGDTKAEEEGA
jgi:signal transduction histidine kinase